MIPQLKVFSFENKDPNVKKKSLTFLSIKLLKLFIIYKENINFKELIKLFGEKYLMLKLNTNDKDLKKSENKNKIRRLYDIVNVFKSLGLIEKVINSSGKSVFQFKGVKGLLENVHELQTQDSNIEKNNDNYPQTTCSKNKNLVRVIVLNELNSNKQIMNKKLNDVKYLNIDEGFSTKFTISNLENKKSSIKKIKTNSKFNKILLKSVNNSFKNKFQSINQNLNSNISLFDSLFTPISVQKDKIPESLTNLKLKKNNEEVSIIGSNEKLAISITEKKIPLLSINHLDKSLREKLKIISFNDKDHFIKSLSQINFKNISRNKKRIKDIKKFLTPKFSILKKTLKKIQKNYFEEEQKIFFKTLYNFLDNFDLFM